jgi:hypothetical protein
MIASIAIIYISFLLYLDWIQIRGEQLLSQNTMIEICRQKYSLNKCHVTIDAMIEQCVEWFACSQTQIMPGTQIWAEVFKRLFDNLPIVNINTAVYSIIFYSTFMLFVNAKVLEKILDVLIHILPIILVCSTILDIVDVMYNK